MFNKKSVVLLSVSLPITLLSLSVSPPNLQAINLNQTTIPKFYNESTQTTNIRNDEQKKQFEANYRIYYSVIAMYIADNNGKAPLRISDVYLYFPYPIINQPIGAKYFISKTSKSEITLTATYGDMVLSGVIENVTSDFSGDQFKSNFNEGVRAMSSFILENEGKMPSRLKDIKKYFDKDIFGDPKGAIYTISKNSQRKTVFKGSYKGVKLEKIFDEKAIDEMYKNKLQQNHKLIISGIEIYRENNQTLPTKLDDIYTYIDKKEISNVTDIKHTLEKNNDGSIVFTSTYKNTKLEKTFSQNSDAGIFNTNFGLGVSAIIMYAADNNGVPPDSMEKLAPYLKTNITDSPKGAKYSFVKDDFDLPVFVGNYGGTKVEYSFYSKADKDAIASFKANFRMSISAVAMYCADNGGLLPDAFEKILPYMSKDVSDTPKGSKYFIKIDSSGVPFLVGTYKGLVLEFYP